MTTAATTATCGQQVGATYSMEQQVGATYVGGVYSGQRPLPKGQLPTPHCTAVMGTHHWQCQSLQPACRFIIWALSPSLADRGSTVMPSEALLNSGAGGPPYVQTFSLKVCFAYLELTDMMSRLVGL